MRSANLIPNFLSTSINEGVCVIGLCDGCSRNSENRIMSEYDGGFVSTLFYMCAKMRFQ
jgi:hypothetical protein